MLNETTVDKRRLDISINKLKVNSNKLLDIDSPITCTHVARILIDTIKYFNKRGIAIGIGN